MPWMNVDLRRRSTGRPEGVQARAVDDAAVVAELALRVDDRHVEPPVVGPEPGRPDDRADLAAAEVERQPRRPRHLRRGEALGSGDLGILPAVRAHSSKTSSSRSQLQVGERADVAQAAGEQRAAVADGRPAADQLDAHRRQRVEVERRPLGRPDELRRRQPPRALEIVDLVVPLVPHAGRVHPPQDVAAAIRSRQPHVLADREDHRPSRLPQLGRQLHAGRRRRRRRARRRRGAGPGCGTRTASAARRRRAPRLRTPAPSAGCRRRSRSPPCARWISPSLVVTW